MDNPVSAPSTKMSAREIRKLKEDIYGWMQKAESITDLQEKLRELTEILSYFSEDVAPELKAEVEKQITETKDKIDLAITEHGRIKETFKMETADQLKEGIKKVAMDTQTFERDASEWKTIAQGLQEKLRKVQMMLDNRPTNEAYKTALDYSKKLKEQFGKREMELIEFGRKAVDAIEEQKAESAALQEKLSVTEKRLEEVTGIARGYKDKNEKLLQSIKERKARDAQALAEREEAETEAMRARMKPQTAVPSMYDGFNESEEVADYYEDLVDRFGEDIKPYEQKIKACKTLKEAMLLYTRIMANMGTGKTGKISEALDPEDRKRLIESRSNVKIRQTSEFANRLPKTWE